jgi:DNA modification methylase
MNVEHWPIAKIVPYARNARIAPESAIAKVAASIKEFGWRQPIVVDEEGVILAGHTRLLAAQRLGFEEIPVHVATGLTATQARAFRLMDNRSAQETSWDLELLPLEFSDLADLDFDLSLSGFEPDEIAAFLVTVNEGRCDPDEIVPPPENPISKPGDLYLLGNHRLLCGDATQADDVLHLMGEERAAAMITDPPYLVDYDGGNHPQTWGAGGQPISSEDKTKHWDAYTDHANAVDFYREFIAIALAGALIERPAVYQWFGMMRADVVLEAWRANGLLAHQVVVWHKSRPVLGRCWFMYDYEPCMVGWVEGNQPKMKPPANARAVWDIDQREGIEDGAGAIHPTMKPVELIRRPVQWHTKPGGLIYEPFSGSGTAIIAAEMTGRHCYAMEISPGFVDAAVLRWERFTGERAHLEDHGSR